MRALPVKYTINFAGILAYLAGSLLIFGITPVPSLSQAETIITGLLLVNVLSEMITLQVSGYSSLLKYAVMVLTPLGFSLYVYAFAQLLT